MEERMDSRNNSKKDTLIIANCSGFFGDRITAAQKMIDGGPIDFLVGDYLAELTMAILFKQTLKDPNKIAPGMKLIIPD